MTGFFIAILQRFNPNTITDLTFLRYILLVNERKTKMNIKGGEEK